MRLILCEGILGYLYTGLGVWPILFAESIALIFLKKLH